MSHPIIGIWSADMLFGPGAASDEVIAFLPDGSGVCEIWNWTLCSYYTFLWRIESDGLLTMIGQTSVGDSLQPDELSFSHIPFTIFRRTTPIYGEIDALKLKLTKWLPNEFGRAKKSVADYTLPKFDR